MVTSPSSLSPSKNETKQNDNASPPRSASSHVTTLTNCKGHGGWDLFWCSSEQLQLQSRYDRHCRFLTEELAEMQQRLPAALQIHKYRCAAENVIAVLYSLHALSRHVKREEVTNMKQQMV